MRGEKVEGGRQMRILEVNCKTCPYRNVTYSGPEKGHCHSCQPNKLIGIIGFGAAYSLPDEPPGFCPLKKVSEVTE